MPRRSGTRFRAAVAAFAGSNNIPVLRFKADDRQIDLVRPLWQGAAHPGVVAIGVAQEFQRVFTARQRPTRDPKVRLFGFDKSDRRVTVYYFCMLDGSGGDPVKSAGARVQEEQRAFESGRRPGQN